MITKELENTLSAAVAEATTRQHEYVTLEHLLLALLNDPTARDVIYNCGGNIDTLKKDLEQFFAEHIELFDPDQTEDPEQTIAFQRVLQYAILQAQASEQKEVNGGNVLAALFTLATALSLESGLPVKPCEKRSTGQRAVASAQIGASAPRCMCGTLKPVGNG